MYALDVHCNAFVPVSALLYGAQFLLLPLLLRGGFLAALLSNALYAAAFVVYYYLTFLGYSELPFLSRCEVFVYPIALVPVALVISLGLRFNVTSAAVVWYLG